MLPPHQDDFGQGETSDEKGDRLSEASAFTLSAGARGALLTQQHFDALARLTPEGIAFHEDGVILYCNPALLRMLGARDEAEIVGRAALDFVHPDSRAVVTERIARMMASGQSVPAAEERFLRLDGEVLEVEVVATPCGPRAVMVLVREIASRKRAKHEIETAQRFLQEVLDRCPNVIFVKDDYGRYVLVNEAMMQAHGMSREDLLGRTNEEVHTVPDFAVQHLAEDLEVMRTGSVVVGDEPFILPDGRRVIYQTVKTAVTLPSGERGVLGVSNDITAIKQAESAARQMSHQLEKRVEQRTSALSALNADLQERVKIERIVAEVARDLAQAPAGSLRHVARTAIARIGVLVQAEHAFVKLLSPDWVAPGDTLEWSRDGKTHPQRDRALHSELFRWAGQALAAQQTVRLEGMHPFPANLAAAQSALEALHIGALVLVPVASSGKLLAYLGADRADPKKGWSDSEVFMLSTVAGILGAALERERALTALTRSEQRLANIVASSPDAISITSVVSGKYVDVSPSYFDVFGYTRDEVVGRVAVEVGVWIEPAHRDAFVAAVMQAGRVLNLNQRMRHQSGRIFDALLSANLIEVGGEPCVLTVSRDISQIKAAEALLARQNATLAALARAQSDFILDADPKATFSRLLEHLLAATESEYGFIGEVLRDEWGAPYLRALAVTDISWNEESRALYRRYIDGSFEFRNLKTLFGHVMATGETVISNEPAMDPRRGGLPAGHPSLDAFLGLPLFRGTELVGMLGAANREGGYSAQLVQDLDVLTKTCALLIEAFRNAQARHAAEDALRRLNDELESRVRERTEALQVSLRELESFSYSVSHDLRSPLRSINGFAQALATFYGSTLDARAHDYLKRIDQATLRMGALIDDLLRLAQVTRAPLHRSEIDLSALARCVCDELAQAEPARTVEVAIAPGIRALADPNLLRAVLENLIGNAWKFSRACDQAKIEFGSETIEGVDAYCVRDNGAGFDMKYAHKLFEVFQRLHGPDDYPGTGIGLATVQRIIHRHGGECWARSEPGRGACFYFTLAGVPASVRAAKDAEALKQDDTDKD